MKTLIKNANIVNEGRVFSGSVLIENNIISKISEHEIQVKADKVIDAKGNYLFPGCIDDQVHFREPGLTHKADIYTESKAAIAGGVTSFMEMPNTIPNVFTQKLLEDKYKIASKSSLANYSFFMGASNDNLDEVLKTNPQNVCGVKVFMGSSTGNMLVDNRQTLEALFEKCKMLIAVHCEDEETVKKNMENYVRSYGENVPIQFHPAIRSAEACYKSSSLAVELAKKYNTRLHVLHISTSQELSLFENNKPIKEKRITCEVCIHHLWFSDQDYPRLGNLIKWNPAIKNINDKANLLRAVIDNRVDVIATDHAPHTLEEKSQSYLKAPSGGPLVQHSLVAMLEFFHNRQITLEKIAEKMAHSVADCFLISKRGYIREGYYADLVLVDLNYHWTVTKNNLLYKCGWSPFEWQLFRSKVMQTFVNGHLVYDNGLWDEKTKGSRLKFDR